MLTIGSLFSGIGGIELGLERAGLGPVIWQAENDPYCLKVLAKHWPSAERFKDVRDINERVTRPDLICGGFPCQPFSVAGKRKGAEDERNLWPEAARVIRLLRPRFVLLENVPALLTHPYIGQIFGDLAACGYDIWWDCIPAAAIGAPHRRDRLYVVARRIPDPDRDAIRDQPKRGEDPAQAANGRNAIAGNDGAAGIALEKRDHWRIEPELDRVVNGFPPKLDRIRVLGNAVVPQVAEFLGSLIVESIRAE